MNKVATGVGRVILLALVLAVLLPSTIIQTAQAATQLKHVHVWWYENGTQKEWLYISPGSSATINRDPGSQVWIRIFKIDSAGAVTYSTTDVNNGISRQKSSANIYEDFTDAVGSGDTDVWAMVNTTEGRVKITVLNIVPQNPDLTVSNIRVDGSVSSRDYQVGERVNVEAIVWNNGQSSAGTSQLGYYIGTSSTDTSYRWAADSVGTLSKSAGSTQNEYYTFRVADIGTRYFVFFADYLGQVSEGSNENNNKASFGPFTVKPQPNQAPMINLSAPSSDVTVIQGTVVTIQWTDSDPDSNATISLARDTDSNPGNGGHTWLALSLPEDSDGSGDQYNWDTTAVQPGTYYVWAMIYDSVNSEVYSVSPGRVTVQAPIPPQIDLTLYRVSTNNGTLNTNNPGTLKGTFLAGETVRITLKAKNTGGSVPAQAVLNVAYTSSHGSLVHNSSNPGDSTLSNNEEEYYSFDYQIPSSAAIGQYDIIGSVRGASFNTVYDDTEPGVGTTGFGSAAWMRSFTVVPNPDGNIRYYAILVGSGAWWNARRSDQENVVSKDVELLRDTLINHGANWGSGQIDTLVNDEVSVQNIDDRLNTIGLKMDGDDVLLFYYSGHGGGSGLAVFSREDYSPSDLRESLDRFIPLSSRAIVILNACESGIFVDSFAQWGRPNTYVMSSSTASEETPIFGLLFLHPSNHSLFNYHLRAALDGGGDSSGNREVSFDEAYHYLYWRVVAGSILNIGLSPVAHPQRYPANDTATIAITKETAPTETIPIIVLSSPATDITVVAGSTVDISWGDSDSDSNATISLARDTDDVENPWAVGTQAWLAGNSLMIPEDPDGSGDHYYWNTTGVIPGTYVIWGMIYDGQHVERYSRAPGRVIIVPDGTTPTPTPSPTPSPFPTPTRTPTASLTPGPSPVTTPTSTPSPSPSPSPTATPTIVSGQIIFGYSGGSQQWVVPDGVSSVDVDIRGAKGGATSDYGASFGGPGAPGGRVLSTLSVVPGETLFIFVGGAGYGGTGGYNGGGAGGSSDGGYPFAGGGGGASDIRRGGIALTNRIVIAGGGGGAKGFYNSVSNGLYGAGRGGGLTGEDALPHSSAVDGGKGGSQSSGGAGGLFNASYGDSGSPGGLGQGGQGGNYRAVGYGGGGGGGGYYGGGGGAASSGGGGGGSSYSAGTNTFHTQGYQLGNGQVLISYQTISPTPSPTATPTPAPTPTPSPTPSPTPTPTGTATPSPTPTASPTPSPTPTLVPATKVQAGTAVVGSGGTVSLPITVKNLTAIAGLGAFDITVTYNSSVINVTNVIGGAAPFGGSPTKSLTTGQAVFNGFQASAIPGPTGDIVVANLVIGAVGAPLQTSALTIVLNASSVIDTDGVSVPAAPINGSVSIFGADFHGSPTSGPAPLAVNFADDSLGSPSSWSWSFGDGTGSSSQNPSHTYTQGGNYTVSLTASAGALSNTRTRANYIQVIQANFTGTPTSGTSPLPVAFTDQSTGTVNSWSWNFGDGAGSSSQNPSHTFSSNGAYNVTLTVNGPAGTSSLTRTAYINVTTVQHIAGFSQVIDPVDNYVYLNVNISRIRNPSTDADVPAPGGIGAYDFRLTYPGGTTGNAVNIMAVKGVAPFSSVTAGTVPNTSGTLSVNSFQTGSAPQPPLTLAQVAPRIIGSSTVSQNIVLTFNSLIDVTGGVNIPADGAKTYTVKRGDARNDGAITIADALFIAQALAGLRDIGDNPTTQTNAVNGSSAKLETTTAGEKMTIADALLIAQKLAGLRDDSFN